jgi:hypothetical protein
MLSIRVMSWDFQRANQEFARREPRFRNAVESAAAQVASQALDSLRRMVAEQQNRPMQARAGSFAALKSYRILELSGLAQAAIGRKQFQRIGGHKNQYYRAFARSLPSANTAFALQKFSTPITCNKSPGFSVPSALQSNEPEIGTFSGKSPNVPGEISP